MKIILASGSPRRKELLEKIGLNFEVILPNVDEKAYESESVLPEELVKILSRSKARAVSERQTDALIIAADTIVELNGEIFGKPDDESDARRMLNLLQNNTHSVRTGVTIISAATEKTFAETTRVTMRRLTEAEITAYIASNEPFDKAGSYAAQGLGSLLIERVDGDFYNVVGLPICALCKELTEFGVKLL